MTTLRIGTGFDAHQFAAGRPLVIGGVEVPADFGIEGHSDADVLSHAIIDALLGAVAMGDIGQHFPPSDERWRGASSVLMLELVVDRLAAAGWRVGNVDGTVIAQRPRLSPYLPAMRETLARALQVAIEQVSVKATTTDHLGFTGRGEGIAALAAATVLSAEC